MNSIKRDLTSIIDKEAKDYAIYTVENRAIPNMMDGFKPAQRFVIYRALELGRGNPAKMHKLASVAGGVADAGYHHGEVNTQEAGALMANTWNNNVPFLEGQGNFGSRLVQEAAASRYVFCRISDHFRKIYKDTNVAPKHEDEEHLPPKHYLPLIPTVLLNGIKGIATGYATQILPHSMASVVESVKQALNGEEVSEPKLQFPRFNGDIVPIEFGKYELHGKYSFTSKTQMYISEVPYKYDRAEYVMVLDDLEDKGWITYTDECSKRGFGFKVKFRKDYDLPTDPQKMHDKIMKDFKLIEKISQYIVVIDENGKLQPNFGSSAELIKHFVEVRKTFVQKRIDAMVVKCDRQFKLAVAKMVFIHLINAGTIVVKNKSKKDLLAEIAANERLTGFEDQLASMNIYHMTDDELERLKEAAVKAKSELEYWQSTTVLIEYNKDLDSLV